MTEEDEDRCLKMGGHNFTDPVIIREVSANDGYVISDYKCICRNCGKVVLINNETD
jgi:hypothetical protein